MELTPEGSIHKGCLHEAQCGLHPGDWIVSMIECVPECQRGTFDHTKWVQDRSPVTRRDRVPGPLKSYHNVLCTCVACACVYAHVYICALVAIAASASLLQPQCTGQS